MTLLITVRKYRLLALVLALGIVGSLDASAQPVGGQTSGLIDDLFNGRSGPAAIASYEAEANRLLSETAGALIRNIPVEHPETGLAAPSITM